MHLWSREEVSELTLIGIVPLLPQGHEVAFGNTCMWWGCIADVKIDDAGRLHCPRCGGACSSTRSEQEFFNIARRFEILGFPFHLELVRWCRNKCFKTRSDAWHSFVLSNGVIG